jgi:tetratricopeptide (TPR) repeat protein
MHDYRALISSAIDAGNRRDYVESIRILKRIIAETDAYPEAFLYLGRGYHAVGDYDRAIPALAYYTERKPLSDAGHFFLGRAYLATGMLRHSAAALHRADRLQPGSAPIQSYLGLAYLRMKRSDVAISFLKQAVENDPENRYVYTGYLNALLVQALKHFHRGEFKESQKMLHFLLEKGVRNTMAYLYLGITERELGNLREALEFYTLAEKASPKDRLIKYQKANILAELGRSGEANSTIRPFSRRDGTQRVPLGSNHILRYLATEYFKRNRYRRSVYYAGRVVRADSGDTDMRLLMGEAYIHLGEYEKALNHFNRILERKKRDLHARYGIVMVRWLKEDWRNLKLDLDRIFRIDPHDDVALYYHPLCLCKLEADVSLTIEKLNEEIERTGADPFLLTALGNEYLRSDDPMIASDTFRKTIENFPEHKPAYHGSIEAKKRLDGSTSVVSAYREYLEHFPDDHEIRKEYSLRLYDDKAYSEAASSLERYITHEPNNYKLLRILAHCYRQTKKFREASIQYRKILTHDPRNEECLVSLIYCLNRLGRANTALELLDGAIRYLQPSWNLLLVYGQMLMKYGRLEEALEPFRKVLEFQPNNRQALRGVGLVYQKKGVAEIATRYLRMAGDP